ncbi:hypothetical protein GOP47_0002235 [Adiantum capillus-veneris]|uniref:Alpha/beta hydrolase fold-3 domain-containing protein n=1 Tax=Adiantum capillus-veneris TaxID=13818 RepID=A0A9D4ZR22_ADICA|nr:hypothetical protein GOP47_0002235 [Adiantum capillus-veneris]
MAANNTTCLLSLTHLNSLLGPSARAHTHTYAEVVFMAAETLSTALIETCPAFVDMSDAAKLSLLATEKGSVSLSMRLIVAVVKKVNDIIRRPDGTLNRRLSDLLEYKVPASEVPDKLRGVSSKDVVINSQTGLWVRIFLPPASKANVSNGMTKMGNNHEGLDYATEGKRRIIVYIHGGGFAVMAADAFIYDQFCRHLCGRSKAVVVSVNYRRSPEHRFPVAHDDCYAVLEWLEGFKGDVFKPHELDLSQCVLMGDSAGANIVHHLGAKWLACDASTHPRSLCVTAHVLLFPFFGGKDRTPTELRMHNKALLVNLENSDWHWRTYLPHGSNRDHAVCNVMGPNAPDLSMLQLPRSLVTIAEFDILKDWQLRYAQGLVQASKPVQLLYYTGGIHSFHVLGDRKLGSRMLSDIVAFIEDGDGKRSAESAVASAK